MPATPGIAFRHGIETRLAPLSCHRNLDFRDRNAPARPRAPEQLDRTPLDQAQARVPIRNAGRHHQRLDPHRRYRDALFVGSVPIDVGADLLEAVEAAVSHLGATEPFETAT